MRIGETLHINVKNLIEILRTDADIQHDKSNKELIPNRIRRYPLMGKWTSLNEMV